MPPDPPREQGPPGLATPSQINATPTSKTVENPGYGSHPPHRLRSGVPPIMPYVCCLVLLHF